MKNSFILALAFSCVGILASAQNFQKQAPQGFDVLKKEIPHGKIDSIQYPSKTVGTVRKALIYTPPGFNNSKKYSPIMYKKKENGRFYCTIILLIHSLQNERKKNYHEIYFTKRK